MQGLTKHLYFNRGEITTIEEVSELVNMFLECVWSINGGYYPLGFLGWEFAFSKTKDSFGTCRRKNGRKSILISKYLLEQNLDKVWEIENVIRHEIAHAIDIEARGTSDHSEIWRNIALQILCDGSRTYSGKIVDKKTKYTLSCGSCGKISNMHRIGKERKHSCGECSPRVFNKKYILDIKINF